MQKSLDKQSLSALDKDDLIALLMRQNETLIAQSARIAVLEKEIGGLKGQLAKNSRNSSKPPSSDGYDKPGHKGSTLKQVEHPDTLQSHTISRCMHCCADLSNQPATAHEVQQVFDLPEIKVAVTEHRAQIKTCPHCDTRVKAEFPAAVTQPAQYGNGVYATATYLSQYQ